MENRILRLPTVLTQIGKSRSAHYRDIQNGLFTKPIHIGLNTVGWPEFEVSLILNARIAGYGDIELRRLVKKLEENRKAAIKITV